MGYQMQGKFRSNNYTPRQIQNILSDIGIRVEGETHNDFLCLCPYHSNRDTPAMTVSREHGTFCCFSPQCGEAGSLLKLIIDTQRVTEFAARRLIIKHGAQNATEFEKDLERALSTEPVFTEYDPAVMDALASNMWVWEDGQNYMHGRGFKDETLKHFEVGYSQKMRMVTVPVKSPQGMRVGFIGRSIEGKDFKNSTRLPKSETLFNIDKARQYETAYVTESSFDAMRIWQAGYKGAVATAGGNLSNRQLHLLNMYFNTIVIMTDFDDKSDHIVKGPCRRCLPNRCGGHNPGRDLGNSIVDKLRNKNVLWGCYDFGTEVYAGGVKDVSDMTDEQIKQTIDNAQPNFIYQQWAPY